jgi:Glycosyltransferase sugar-binding region containing DXD motif
MVAPRLTSGTRYQVRPVFAYWSDNDHSILAELTTEWRAEFPQFQIFRDDDVIQLIERYFPSHVELYKALRIPAAKADIARLLLLYELGGLYIDCHCGIRDADEVRRLISSLEQIELIFIDRTLSRKPRPPEEHFLTNSIIFSRARSDLIFMICRQAFANLVWHREQERKKGKVLYQINYLSGPGLITAMALQPGSYNRDVRWDFQGRIMIIPEEVAPIVRSRNRTYGGAGQHWSERQKVEPLFEN